MLRISRNENMLSVVWNAVGRFTLASGKICASTLLICCLFALASFAQAPPSSSVPSGYQVSYSGDINYYSGTANFNLPLLTLGGRGEANFTMVANVGQQKWQINVTRELVGCNVPGNPQLCTYRNIYTPIMYAESPVTKGLSPGRMQVIHTGKYPVNASCTSGTTQNDSFFQRLTTVVFTMGGGNSVTLRDTLNDGRPMDGGQCSPTNGPSRGTVFEAWDGSGMTFVSDTPLEDKWTSSFEFPSGYLYLKNGVKYRIENGNVTKITDRNGNWINFDYGGNNFPYSGFTATDSIGRTVIVETLPDNTVAITTKRQNNATRTIKIYQSGGLRSDYSPIPMPQAFPELNGAQRLTAQSIAGGSINQIELPDGRKYNFKYEPYGGLARIETPTGGAIEYDWASGTGTGSGAFAGGDNGGSYSAYGFVYRRAIEKRVYDNGGNGANYTNKTTISNSSTTSVVNVREYETGNSAPTSRIDHFYIGNPTDGFYQTDPFYPEDLLSGIENKTEFYAGDGTQLLRRSENTWQVRATSISGANKDPRLAESKNTLADSNQVSKTTFSYDNFNNQTDVYEYDFGTGAPGAFVRRSHTDYVTDPNYTNYTGASLKSLPTQSWVSSDINGTNIVSLSQIEYDNYASDARHAPLVSRSNVVGHDTTNYGTSYTRRGNPTQSISYSNAANQTGAIARSVQYDILGNIVKVIDANGNAATVSFNDNFGVPDGEARTNSAPAQLNGQQTFALPTSATNSNGWTSYGQFDYFTGAKIDAEDINGNVNTAFYNDVLDRPTQTISANNTSFRMQSTIVYDDANRRVQSTSDLFAFGDNLAKSESFYDALGRTFENRSYKDGTYITSKQEFDALGRAKRATNPYKSGETVLWTTSNYDALSRPISITTPDGATVTMAYSGNTVTVTDQAGKQRRSITNGIGQLVRVDEPNEAGNLGSVGSPTQPTSYSYDTLNNLIQVNQGVQVRTFGYDSLSRLKQATNPESGLIQYNYDNNSNLTQKTDARNVVTNYVYDNINRVTSRNYSDGTPAVTYTYENTNMPFSKGRLTQVTSAISTTNYTNFDNLGRILTSQQITDGQTYNFGYSYNLSGALVNQTYPSGRIVTNQFEVDGDLAQVNGSLQSQNKTYVGNFSYTSAGAVSSLQLGNGKWENTQFNARLQPVQIGLGSSANAQDLWKVNYDYGQADNNGNVKSQTITVPSQFTAIQNYNYDSLNRLKSANEVIGNSQTWKQTFDFDRYGNRKFDPTQTTTLGNCPQNICNPDINSANNRVVGHNFDNSGNTTVDAEGRTFFYDAENKQKEVRDAQNNIIGQYLYDGDGKRVKKISNAETTIFVYDAAGKLVSEYLITTSNSQAPTTSYLTNDTLGSPRVITDASGNVTSRRDFMPYGEEVPRANQGQDSIREKFATYERDNETELDFAQARMYSSKLGRFSTTDPDNIQAMLDITRPQSWNAYAYVNNQPTVSTDPTGKCDWCQRLANWIGGYGRITNAERNEELRKRRGEIYAYIEDGGTLVDSNTGQIVISVVRLTDKQVWQGGENIRSGRTVTREDVGDEAYDDIVRQAEAQPPNLIAPGTTTGRPSFPSKVDRGLTNSILRGDTPREAMSAADREIAAKFYEATAPTTVGGLKNATRLFNEARANYLRNGGTAPGGSITKWMELNNIPRN